MTNAEKALLSKELVKASASLQRAFLVATNANRIDLARRIRTQQVNLAEEITRLNGGPVKLTGADLLSS